MCHSYYSSTLEYFTHQTTHTKTIKSESHLLFKLSNHYKDPKPSHPPTNLLKIPVLSSIETSRKVTQPLKLPLIPEILESFLKSFI
jgi:hypothetical protein